MKALTIKAPFVWAILEGHKKVENRGWKPPTVLVGQRIAIHAAKACSAADVQSVRDRVDAMPTRLPDLGSIAGTVLLAAWFKMPETREEFERDGAAYEGELTEDQLSEFIDSDWFSGPVGFVLREPRWLKESIPCKGQLGFWNVPEAIEARIKQ